MPRIVPLPLSAPPLGPPGAGPDARASLTRLARRGALLLSALRAGVAAFMAVVLVLGLACGGSLLWLAPGAAYLGVAPEGVADLVPFGALPPPTRLAYAAGFLLAWAPVLGALAEGQALLREVARGTAFAAGHARRLRRAAAWLCAYALAPALGQGLVQLAGHGVDRAWFHASLVHALVLAALLAVLAELMRIGHAIERDRDGFV